MRTAWAIKSISGTSRTCRAWYALADIQLTAPNVAWYSHVLNISSRTMRFYLPLWPVHGVNCISSRLISVSFESISTINAAAMPSSWFWRYHRRTVVTWLTLCYACGHVLSHASFVETEAVICESIRHRSTLLLAFTGSQQGKGVLTAM